MVAPPKEEQPVAAVPPRGEEPEKAAAARPPSRLPVPDEEASKNGLAMVHDIYKDELAKAKTVAEKMALAKKLFEEGRKTQNDVAGRYALLQAAHQLAVGAGDATVAFETADEISRLYEVDALDMKAGRVRQDAQGHEDSAAAGTGGRAGLRIAGGGGEQGQVGARPATGSATGRRGPQGP